MEFKNDNQKLIKFLNVYPSKYSKRKFQNNWQLTLTLTLSLIKYEFQNIDLGTLFLCNR